MLLGDAESDVVVMMKIDTEGAEFGIMRALLPAMRAGRILNMLVEINKGVTEPNGEIHWPEWRHRGACARACVLAQVQGAHAESGPRWPA